MSAVSVHPAKTTGHETYPPVQSTSGEDFWTIDGKPVIVVGTAFGEHSDDDGDNLHAPAMSVGSNFVTVNGTPVCRIGDDLDCGDVLASANNFVFVGS